MKKPMKKMMGKRTKRFGTGGETSDENAAGSQVEFSPEQEEWLGGADRTDPYILARMRKAVPDKETSTLSPRIPVAPAKTESVKTEPAKLANNINPESGEKYTPVDQAAPYKDARLVSEPPTSVKKPKPKPKIEAKPKPAPTTNEDVKRLREIDKPLENVNPEEYLIPGGALKGLAALSSKLIAKQAAKAEDKAFNAARNITPKVKQIGMDAKRIGMDARKEIGYDKKRIGYSKPKGSSSGSRNTSTSSEFKKGADDQLYPFKKGGKVKKMASGGRVSSASSRGDGCAIRGKTRA